MTRFRYRHIQSTVENRKPSDLLDGEIAVNRFEGKEKLFIKNASNEIVSFSSDGQIDGKLANKLNVSDFNTYSGAVDTAINSKAAQTDLSTLSGTVTAHTASTNIHLSATEKTNIDSLATNIAAISGITSTKVGNWNTAYGKVSGVTASTTAINSLTGSVGTMAFKNANSYSSATEVNTALGNKVDKVSGKGLSTNDFTNALKTKLDNIASGAEVNVQADWTETATTADSYIKNKPTLGTAAAKGVSNGISNTDNLIESKHIYSGVGVTVSYDSSTHYIQLKSTSGNVLSSFDASAFLVDGMVDSVTLDSKSGTTYLVITWNTAAGKTKTELNIGDIFEADNYYTKNDLTATTGYATVTKANSANTASTVALTGVTGADDLKAIEALTGTSGILKKTAANTWSLDTTSYSSATQVSTALGNKVDKVSGKGLSTNDYTTDEKNKLSDIAAGAEVNQNAFSNIKVGSTTVAADSKTDTLEISGSGIVTITADATNDKITISASNAVTSVAGKTGAVTLVKGDVGLGNVDNTADASKKVASAATAAVAESVTWNNVSGKPETYTPSAHNQASNTITAMTGYAKASTAAAIASGDTLNAAIGKLEKALDGKQPSGSYVTTGRNVSTGAGLVGGGNLSADRTIKAALSSETKSSLSAASMGSTANRQYAVGLDANGVLSVNVPWTNTNNGYVPTGRTITTASGLTGGGNLSANLTIGHSNNITAGSAKTSSSSVTATPSGANIAIPVIEYDAQGHIKSTGSTNVSLKVNTAATGTAGVVKIATTTGTNNSDTVMTQSAVTKAIEDSFAAQDAMVYKGLVGSGTNYGFPTTFSKGYTYKVATAFTADSVSYEIGDMFIANTDVTTAENYTKAHWDAIQANLDPTLYVNTARTITTASGLTGGGNLSTNRTIGLATVGTAGTYYRVVVDEYGRVTSGNTTDANTNYYTTGLTVSTAETSNTITVKGNNSAVTGTAVLNSATTSAAGLMSKADKTKLNGIATGAEVNQNAFSKIKINAESTTIDADDKTDTLTISGGAFVTLTSDATNDKFTIGVSTGTSSSDLARGDHNHDGAYQAKGSYLTGTTNYAGSSSQGGAATSANKLNTDAGSATNPIYFSGGVPTALSYTIEKSVPSNAVFTDTKVTAVGNHYTPSATSADTKSATASSTSELNWGSAVVTGVTLSGDAKGHITSVALASGKLKTPVTGVTLASGTNNGTVKLTVNGSSTDNIAVKGLSSMAYQATSSYSSATEVNTALSGKQNTLTFDGTYNASTNKAATVSTVTNAIGALDASLTGSAGAGKTLTAFSQTNGKVTATFGNISITKSQVSDFAHNQASDTITAMTSYSMASASGAVATSDSLNTAVGKLEKRIAILEAAIGGMTLVKLTSAQYEALTTKDPNTMYIIND